MAPIFTQIAWAIMNIGRAMRNHTMASAARTRGSRPSPGREGLRRRLGLDGYAWLRAATAV